MMNEPEKGKRRGLKNRKRKELNTLGTARPLLKDAGVITVKPCRRKNKANIAKYEQLKAFDAEIMRRCRENGMSDGEIRKWMREI